MPKYRVDVRGVCDVTATITVEAEDADEAEDEALAEAENLRLTDWELEEGSLVEEIDIEDVEEIPDGD